MNIVTFFCLLFTLELCIEHTIFSSYKNYNVKKNLGVFIQKADIFASGKIWRGKKTQMKTSHEICEWVPKDNHATSSKQTVYLFFFFFRETISDSPRQNQILAVGTFVGSYHIDHDNTGCHARF